MNKTLSDKVESSESVRKEFLSYILQNYSHLRTCPSCGYESFEYTKCKNEDCKDNSIYGSPTLLPTQAKATEQLKKRLDNLLYTHNKPKKVENRERIKKDVLLKDSINTWSRNWGLDDDCQLSAEEAYEMLEDGVLHFLSERDKQLYQSLEEMKGQKPMEDHYDMGYNVGWNKAISKAQWLFYYALVI